MSLVVSHTVGDGLHLKVTDAVNENPRELGYPFPAARSRREARREDLRQTMRAVTVGSGAVVGAAGRP